MVVSIVHKVCVLDFKGNQVCREERGSRYVAFVADGGFSSFVLLSISME